VPSSVTSIMPLFLPFSGASESETFVSIEY
jgi:hypothetical protein